MSLDAVLVAPGMARINRADAEPATVPVRESFEYERFAAALGDALGASVDVVDLIDPGLADAGLLFVPTMFLHTVESTVEPEVLSRTMLIDAAINDPARVALRGMRGALTAHGMDRWRGGDSADRESLFGLASAAERMGEGVTPSGGLGKYAYLWSDAVASLPALTAAYLRALD